jgi:hypothetical protein
VIGGICLSKGLNPFHNVRALKEAKEALDLKENIFEDHKNNVLASCKKQRKALRIFIKNLSEESFIERNANDLVASYMMGFKNGMSASMENIDNDYFLLAKEMRGKLVRKQIFEALNN